MRFRPARARVSSVCTPQPTPSTAGRGTSLSSAPSFGATRRSNRRPCTWSTASIPPRVTFPKSGCGRTSGTTLRRTPRPLGFVQVLATLDESSYTGGTMARTTRSRGAASTTAGAPGTPRWATRTRAGWSRFFFDHLLGGIAFAAGWPDCPAGDRRARGLPPRRCPGAVSTTDATDATDITDRRARGVAILGPAPPDRGGIARETALLAAELGRRRRGVVHVLAALSALARSPPFRRRSGLPAPAMPDARLRGARSVEPDGRSDRAPRAGGPDRPLVDGFLGLCRCGRSCGAWRACRRRRAACCSATTSRTTRAGRSGGSCARERFSRRTDSSSTPRRIAAASSGSRRASVCRPARTRPPH